MTTPTAYAAIRADLTTALDALAGMDRPTADQIDDVAAHVYEARKLLDTQFGPRYLFEGGAPESGRQFFAMREPRMPLGDVAEFVGESIAEVIASVPLRVWMDEPHDLPESEIVFGTPEYAAADVLYTRIATEVAK